MTWPLTNGGRVQMLGAETVDSSAVVLTNSGVAHTKGAWTELVAATDFEAHELTVYIVSTATSLSGAEGSALLDIGVGAAGSEKVLVPNLLVGHKALRDVNVYRIPVRIPAGSRVAARYQHREATGTCEVVAMITGGPGLAEVAGSFVTAYGPNPANSRGVETNLSGVANTKGTWAELSSGLSHPTRWLIVGIQGRATSSMASGKFLADIGVGAAGSEKVLVPNIFSETGTDEAANWIPVTIPVRIPAGTRIAARAQSTLTTANGVCVMAVYGVT